MTPEAQFEDICDELRVQMAPHLYEAVRVFAARLSAPVNAAGQDVAQMVRASGKSADAEDTEGRRFESCHSAPAAPVAAPQGVPDTAGEIPSAPLQDPAAAASVGELVIFLLEEADACAHDAKWSRNDEELDRAKVLETRECKYREAASALERCLPSAEALKLANDLDEWAGKIPPAEQVAPDDDFTTTMHSIRSATLIVCRELQRIKEGKL